MTSPTTDSHSPSYDLAGKRIWIAGHRGMVGSALLRRLRAERCKLLTVPREELDLRDALAVDSWMARERPQVVLLAAAKVGGILANDTHKVAFLQDNLQLELSVIAAAAAHGVERLVFLGSSCVYPKLAQQPIHEEALLSGPLEPTNQWYAIAKIAGIKLCEAYFLERGLHFSSLMPTNLYGPGDNFDPLSSHVLPALLRRIHDAKASGLAAVTLWGTGGPRREFLHVDDCADAVVHATRFQAGGTLLNVGTGRDLTIAELAALIADVVGWRGRFVFDTSKPDGTPRKQLDIAQMSALGWRASIGLRAGIEQTYEWFLASGANAPSGPPPQT